LLKSKFEIIVTLIGVTEETGNTIQVFLCSLQNKQRSNTNFNAGISELDHITEK